MSVSYAKSALAVAMQGKTTDEWDCQLLWICPDTYSHSASPLPARAPRVLLAHAVTRGAYRHLSRKGPRPHLPCHTMIALPVRRTSDDCSVTSQFPPLHPCASEMRATLLISLQLSSNPLSPLLPCKGADLAGLPRAPREEEGGLQNDASENMSRRHCAACPCPACSCPACLHPAHLHTILARHPASQPRSQCEEKPSS